MKILRHYCIGKKRIAKFLEKYKVPYSKLYDDDDEYVFDLEEGTEIYQIFKRKFPLQQIETQREKIYSKEDLEQAEWLSVRSFTEKIIVDELDDKTVEQSCYYRGILWTSGYRHLKQIGKIQAEKMLKWGNRHFFCGFDWGCQNFLFCSERTRKLLEGQWNGLEFIEAVQRKSGKNIPDIYQMVFKTELPIQAFETGKGSKEIQCELCGKKMIYIPDCGIYTSLKIKKEYLKDYKDVYNTGQILTYNRHLQDGFGVHIVSKEFYRFCEERKMNRGLIYEPIEVV